MKSFKGSRTVYGGGMHLKDPGRGSLPALPGAGAGAGAGTGAAASEWPPAGAATADAPEPPGSPASPEAGAKPERTRKKKKKKKKKKSKDDVDPRGWRTATNPEGRTYYFHVTTRYSQYEEPAGFDEVAAKAADVRVKEAYEKAVEEADKDPDQDRPPPPPPPPPPPRPLPPTPVVLGHGSGTLRVGFCGEYLLRHSVPVVYGRPKSSEELPRKVKALKRPVVCEDVAANWSVVNTSRPVSAGIIEDWEGMEAVWRHMFKTTLQEDPWARPVLATEPCFNPRENREWLAQVLFESVGVSHLYLAHEAVLPLYALGKTSGITVDVGLETGYVVPVHEGYALDFAVPLTGNVAGVHVQERATQILRGMGAKVDSPAAQLAVQDILESMGFVSMDPLMEDPEEIAREYQLPDGTILELGKQRFEPYEQLFRPQDQPEGGAAAPGAGDAKDGTPAAGVTGARAGAGGIAAVAAAAAATAATGTATATAAKPTRTGLAARVLAAARGCDEAIQQRLMRSIVCCGGVSCAPNFDDRLKLELDDVLRRVGLKAELLEYPTNQRKNLCVVGGSVLAHLGQSLGDKFWVTKAAYDEYGPQAIERCF